MLRIRLHTYDLLVVINASLPRLQIYLSLESDARFLSALGFYLPDILKFIHLSGFLTTIVKLEKKHKDSACSRYQCTPWSLHPFSTISVQNFTHRAQRYI